MKLLLTGLVALALLAVAACESTGGNDGISRFADSSYYGAAYYGPGSPPRES
jgi:hypothetical protein